MDPNLPVPSKIGQKSEMCLIPHSTAQNAQNSTYSSIQNKNILSVTQWELLLFHVLTLELFIALELTQKELSQTKINLAVALSWTVYGPLLPARSSLTSETYRQSYYSKSFNVVLFMWLHVSKQ